MDVNRAEIEKVIYHHLGAFSNGIDDVMADYNEESILVTQDKTYIGLNEIRTFFNDFIENSTSEFWEAFEVEHLSTEYNATLLVWSAVPFVEKAVDTIVVVDGKIKYQNFTVL
ncbi:hypothetical protein [Neptuniibacter sp. CAU 1671]|uniref:hypothetical protein n=1 Tax=Neptuniibacter sp. CAU 1671 TaxID=3032593 RepID=UPI0023DB4C55|nr:hypothetical protein [Neptuniibacter sp. CAU 1671]MDF2180571.1 hypothetical protein [Neptuniibacter sp. CAU 1671]